MRYEPKLRFNCVDLETNKTREYSSVACFASLWYKKPGNWAVEYFPTFRCNTTDALKFFHDMKDVGFEIDDPAILVTKGSYAISAQTSMLGSPTPHAWLFGNLTLVRYVDEFTSVINEYLKLRELMPEANKFHLLQLAHFTHLSSESGTFYGSGHCLVDKSLVYVPERYRSWEGALARCKNRAYGIQSTFSGRFGSGEKWNDVRGMLRSPQGVKEIHEAAANAKE